MGSYDQYGAVLAQTIAVSNAAGLNLRCCARSVLQLAEMDAAAAERGEDDPTRPLGLFEWSARTIAMLGL